jgi:hypothetical protein
MAETRTVTARIATSLSSGQSIPDSIPRDSVDGQTVAEATKDFKLWTPCCASPCGVRAAAVIRLLARHDRLLASRQRQPGRAIDQYWKLSRVQEAARAPASLPRALPCAWPSGHREPRPWEQSSRRQRNASDTVRARVRAYVGAVDPVSGPEASRWRGHGPQRSIHRPGTAASSSPACVVVRGDKTGSSA